MERDCKTCGKRTPHHQCETGDTGCLHCDVCYDMLAAADALDACYAAADAEAQLASAAVPPDCDEADPACPCGKCAACCDSDESAELHRAALSRGQP